MLYICSIDQKTSKEIKTDYGPDVDWVLRGSGSLSRGSAGTVNHHSLGIDGASGQIYGSNVSLQVIIRPSNHVFEKTFYIFLLS